MQLKGALMSGENSHCIYLHSIHNQPFYVGRGTEEDAHNLSASKRSQKWNKMSTGNNVEVNIVFRHLSNRAASLIQSSLVQVLNRFYLMANLEIPVEYKGTTLLDAGQVEKTLRNATIDEIQLEIKTLKDNLSDIMPLMKRLETLQKAMKMMRDSSEKDMKATEDFLSISAFCTNLQKGRLIKSYMFVKKRIESIMISRGVQAFDKVFINKEDKVIKYKCYRPADLWAIFDENKLKWKNQE